MFISTTPTVQPDKDTCRSSAVGRDPWLPQRVDGTPRRLAVRCSAHPLTTAHPPECIFLYDGGFLAIYAGTPQREVSEVSLRAPRPQARHTNYEEIAVFRSLAKHRARLGCQRANVAWTGCC